MRQHFRAAKAIKISSLLCPLLLEMLVKGRSHISDDRKGWSHSSPIVAVDHP